MTPGDTRSAILDLAEDLLQSRSFNSFSYQDIADRIGIRKASIHYHFASKEDLGVALVERFRRRNQAWASDLVERNASPEEMLEAYLELHAGILMQGNKICPQGILGAEFNALPERMKESYKELLEEHQRWLLKVLAKGQANGTFSSETPPEELAILLQAAIQGSLQIARASGRPERYHAAIEGLHKRTLQAPQAASVAS